MNSSVHVCHHYRVDRVFKEDDTYPIYFGTNTQICESVVMKAEDIDAKFSFNGYSGSRLFYEGKVLQALQGGQGIPCMHW
jgi:hypothetical protein